MPIAIAHQPTPLRLHEDDDERDEHADIARRLPKRAVGRRVQKVQAEDEERDCDEIEQSGAAMRHLPPPLPWNICSMRSVTAKPPKTLIAPSVTAAIATIVSAGAVRRRC